jgi:lysozyme
MYLSQVGFDFIKHFEGLRLKAYRDGGGVWTIGYGHTKTAKPGMTISQEWAEKLLIEDVWFFERGVETLVTVDLSQPQFDALVSFSFNVGLDQDDDLTAEGLGDSTLLRKLNGLDYIGAAEEFLRWNKDNGKVVAGLTRRRKAERDLFLSGTGAGG